MNYGCNEAGYHLLRFCHGFYRFQESGLELWLWVSIFLSKMGSRGAMNWVSQPLDSFGILLWLKKLWLYELLKFWRALKWGCSGICDQYSWLVAYPMLNTKTMFSCRFSHEPIKWPFMWLHPPGSSDERLTTLKLYFWRVNTGIQPIQPTKQDRQRK